MTRRLVKALDGLSGVGNVLIYNGDPNYSISGEAYRCHRPKTRRLIDWLFSSFGKDHCKQAYLHDVQKARALIVESFYFKESENA